MALSGRELLAQRFSAITLEALADGLERIMDRTANFRGTESLKRKRDNDIERSRLRRQARIAAGECTRCGVPHTAKGTVCGDCRQYLVTYKRKAREIPA